MSEDNKDVIGRIETIDFPEAGIYNAPAKIDTGADRSSIWASDIDIIRGELHYKLFDRSSPLFTGEEIVTDDFTISTVKNSMGGVEVRYVVKLQVLISERKVRASFGLSNRYNNRYPILIGRRLLKDRFLVDVADSDSLLEPEINALNSDLKKELLERLEEDPKRAKQPLRIAILSRGRGNYSTRRLLHEAEIRGHKAEIINHAQCYVEIEQDNPRIRYKGKDLIGFDAIIPRIGSSITKYGTAIVRQFEMRGVFTTAKSIAIVRARDKLRSLQLLSKAGVGIPRTFFSREANAVDDLIEQIGTPMIIKVAKGTQGKGVVLAETRKAAKSVIQAFYVEDVNILIQEFIAEAGGSDVRAFVVGNRVVASMKRQSLTDDFRSNLHQGGSAVPVKLTEEERKTAIKAAKAMGLPICGVDLIQSDRGPLVLEVNSSPGLKGIETTTGRDVAGKILEYIEANAKRKQRKDKVGA